jgi:predicted nuclease of predicted toxin-antitoxin system
VKFLLDQNISHRLVSVLRDLYPGSVHVRDTGLGSASDEAVWKYAAQHNLAILSKDADFHQRSFLHGHPPKVVWVRHGNCSTRQIEALLRQHHRDMLAFEKDREGSFLIIE